MEAFLSSLNAFSTFPAYGLLALVVLMILTGKINPKSYADDIKADRDNWRAAYEKSEEGSKVKDAQITELLEVSKTVTHLIHSLPGGDRGGFSRQSAE